MGSPDIQARLNQLSPAQRARLKAMLAEKKRDAGIPRCADSARQRASFVQQRLWTLEQLNAAQGSPYNISHALMVSGPLDVEVLRTSWQQLLQRHAVLRTHFSESAEGLMQEVRSFAAWGDTFCDLSEKDDPAVVFREMAGQRCVQPLDEADLPLCRLHIFALSEDRHGLLWVIHHSLCDGQSIPVLFREFEQLYQHHAGRGLALEEAPRLRYLDFSTWQHGQVSGEKGQADLDFWSAKLATLPEPLALPLDHPRPPTQDFAGGHVYREINPITRAALEELGASEGASLFMTLLALYRVFLTRLTGQEDIVIGCPVSGRVQPELAEMVGCFVNSLALRVPLDPHTSFRTYLQAVRSHVMEAIRHQALPFDLLVEELNLPREPNRSPLFDAMIGVEEAGDEDLSLGDLTVEAVPLATPVSKVDLTFHFRQQAEGLQLDIEYATALFEPGTVAHWADLFLELLTSAVREPDKSTALLNWLGEAERQQVTEAFALNPAPYPETESITALFQAQVAVRPEAPAVFFAGESYTYRWLDAESTKLAVAMQVQHGIRAEDPVGVFVERSASMLVALLGILKAGGAYVPFNVDTPRARLETICEDAGVRVMLHAADWPEELETLPVRLVDLREPREDAPSDWQPETVGPESLAYIMFTSGSTGTPKGILIEQGSVVRLVKGTDYHQVQPGERVLQGGSLAFDASTFEIWGPLLNGGVCCLPQGKTLLEPEAFAAFLEASQVETAFFTTGFFNQLVDFSPEAFTAFRTILTGGEKVSLRHVNRLREAYPELKLLHVYGPTENTTFSTWFAVEAAHTQDVPIGKPLANSEIFVLDPSLQPTPIGVPGEIYCGGAGLARGYLNRLDLTAEAFLPHPYSPRPGARLYKTGDLGYWNADGQIVFVGRNDHQVKIRGFRIELGEIETRLRAHAAVQKAVVIARPLGGTHELNAYVVLKETVSADTLRSWLTAELPDYMAPARFITLDALPLNASGKVDQKALPEPESQATLTAEASFAVPEGEREQMLAEVLAGLLGLSQVSRDDSYFTLGGDSIKAIQLGARLAEAGWQLKLTDIFAHPTIHELAALMHPKEVAVSVRQEPLTGVCGMTPIQRWFLAEHEGPYAPFNQLTLLKAKERLDPEKLVSALRLLVERHDALRLRVTRDAAGEWRHTYEPPKDEILCPVFAWQDETPSAAYALMESEAAALQKEIALETGELMRCALFRLPDGDRFCWAIHHWAVDGVSWRILLEELTMLYADADAPLPAASLSLHDWTAVLENWRTSPAGKADQAYWESWRLPTETQKPALGQPQESAFSLDVEMTQRFLGDAHQYVRTRPQELLLAAFSLAWQEIETKELVVGMESHGRDVEGLDGDLARTVGWFTALYPVQVPVAENGDPARALLAIKEHLRTVPHDGVGYGLHRYGGDVPVSAGFPEISFNYLGVFETAADGLFVLAPEEMPGLTADHLMRDFVLNVVAAVEAGILRVRLLYLDQSFPPEKIEQLQARFAAHLEELMRVGAEAQPILTAIDTLVQGLTQARLETLCDANAYTLSELEAVWPATAMQAGILLHSVGSAETGHYVDQVHQRIVGEIHPDHFLEAWRAVVRRHPVLRSAFFLQGTETPLQFVARTMEPDVELVSFAHADPAQARAERDAYVLADRARGFTLDKGPLFRVRLLRVEDEAPELLLTLHHSILDGWSAGLLMEEFLQLYQQALTVDELASKLAAPVSFERFIRYQQRSSVEAPLAYWQAHLADAPSGCLPPGDGSGWDDAAHIPVFSSFDFGEDLTRQVENAAREVGVTINTFLQAAWGVALQALLGEDDVVFGATVSGREVDLPEVERIVGLLINTIPIRVRDDGMAWADLLQSLSADFAQAREHSQVALPEIQAAAGVPDLVRHTFIFENHEDPAAHATDLPFQLETISVHDPMHFDFGVLVIPLTGDYRVRFVANGRRYTSSQLRLLFKAWQTMLSLATTHGDASVASLKNKAALPKPEAWVVTGTFTTEGLEEPLRHLAQGRGKLLQPTFTGFGQVFQELLQPHSALAQNTTGVNAILLHLLGWCGEDAARWQETLEMNLDTFVDALKARAQAMPGSLFLVHLPPQPVKSQEMAACFASCAQRLQARLKGLSNVVISSSSDTVEYGTRPERLLLAEEVGGLPYTEEGLAALAMHLVRLADARRRRPVKVIAVDADNTLWDGIVGEDGLSGLGLSSGRLSLQKHLKTLQQSGVLLAVVTKNNPSDFLAALRELEGMLLTEDDFVSIKASWQPKSQSFTELAEELNLGLDSFVFLDDSSLEVAEVQAACPSVLTLQVPSAEELDAFLRHLWLFDTVAQNQEDTDRTRLYRDQAKRVSFQAETASYGAFLEGLNLKVSCFAAAEHDLPRAAQLTQRTNQFNTSGWRLTEATLKAWLAQEESHLILVRAEDRFGDYGICGALFIEMKAESACVRNLLLSCRALGRGVEHAMLRQSGDLLDLAPENHLEVIWEKSSKNAPATTFLQASSARYEGTAEAGSFFYPAVDLAGLKATTEPEPKKTQPRQSVKDQAGQIAPSVFYQKLADEYRDLPRFVTDTRRQNRIQPVSERAAYVEPVTEQERLVAQVFSDVLQVERVGRMDHLFALGGHSLKVVMILGRLQADHGYTLELDAFLAEPVVHVVAGLLRSAEEAALPPLEVLPPAEAYPVSRAQARMCMLCQLRDEAGLAYHMPLALTLRGDLDISALRDSFAAIIERHESLRTVFFEQDGETRQRVQPSLDALPWSYVEEPMDTQAFREAARVEMAKPFNLETGPLVRARLEKLADDSYGFVFTMHHIISDGWSVGLLARELSEGYRQRKAGQPLPNGGAAIQSKEFAAWQSAYLENAPDDTRFWIDTLTPLPEPLNLPLDAPRPAVKSSEGAFQMAELPSAQGKQLQKMAQARGVSLFNVLLAGLQVWLHRYTGSTDFCLGTPVAGRPRREFEEVVGYFVNVLPLRAQLSGEESLEDWLTTSSAQTRSALAHQHYPFDQLVEALPLARDMSRAPLFDVLFALQNAELSPLALEGVVAAPCAIDFQPSQYDLAFNVFTDEDTLRVRLEYDPALFRAERIARMLDGWFAVLEALIASPTKTVAEVDVLPASETKKIARFEAGEAYGAATHATMHELVARAALVDPEKRAVTDEETTLTYAALQDASERLAQALRARFGNSSCRIGLLAKRSTESVVAMLAILRAGYVYVPLDPAYPAERLRFILEDSAVAAVLVDDDGIDLPASPAPWLPIASLRAPESLGELPDVSPEAIAYCIYTSGSTGKPKGTLVSHQAFATMILAQVDAFDVRPDDHCGQFASFAFDASLSEIFLALVTGASLHLAPEKSREDTAVFMDWLRREKVTALTLPPPFIRALGRQELKPLRVLVSAGEAPDADLLHYHAASMRVLNAYGPSEASVCATAHVVKEADGENIPLGRALAPCAIRLLDEHGQRVPWGADGEICISGPTVGDGYWGRADLTAEKFRADPYAAGAKLYRTGDLGRWNEAGQLLFLGRRDHQVKIRGFRVETTEVEAVLEQVADVQAAHVLPVEDNLAAFYVGEIAEDTLRQRCHAQLPAYMVPTFWVSLEEVPLTPNKKVDRQALKALLNNQRQPETAFEAPQGEVEEVLAQIWQTVLGLERVGRQAHFFALGGESIKALQVLNGLRDAGWEGRLKDLFAHDCLRDFALSLRPLEPTTATRALDLPANLPLTPIQAWFFRQHQHSDWEHFNMGLKLTSASPLDREKLKAAIQVVWETHPMLRAVFPRDADGQRFCRVQTASAISPEIIYVEGDSDLAFTGPFDLEAGPLIRCVLTEANLRIIAHHLIIDWVSWRLILQELEAAYLEAAPDGGKPVWDTCRRAENLLAWAENHAEDKAYWAAQLPQMPQHDFHSGLYRDAHLREITFSADVSEAWQTVGREAQNYLLAALAQSIWKVTEVKEAAILLESHGRQETCAEESLSQAVGWFTALYPVRLAAEDSPEAMLSQVQTTVSSVPNQGLGYGVWTELVTPPLPAAQPLASLNYLGEFQAGGGDGLWSRMESSLPGLIGNTFERDHPIDLNAWVLEGELHVMLACANEKWLISLAETFSNQLNLMVLNGSESASTRSAHSALEVSS